MTYMTWEWDCPEVDDPGHITPTYLFRAYLIGVLLSTQEHFTRMAVETSIMVGGNNSQPRGNPRASEGCCQTALVSDSWVIVLR